MTNELTIQGFFNILKRRRKIIVSIMGICLLLGTFASLFLKARYRSIGEIEVQKSKTDSLGLENPANRSEDSSDALDASITVQTQANILQSPSLALKVIEDLHLEQSPDLKPGFNPIGWIIGLFAPSGVQEPQSIPLASAPYRRERAIKAFQRRLKVVAVPGTRLIDVQYTSLSPRTAAAVVNDTTKSLVDHTLQNHSVATSQVSNWLSGQMADLKKQAEIQQGNVERLQRESGIYSFGTSDAQGKEMAYSATLDRLQEATQELSSATSSRILKGALYKTVQDGDPELISGLAGSSLGSASSAGNNSFLLLQSLRTQQAERSSQIALDVSRYGSANPKLDEDQASLNSINAEIDAEVKRIGKRASNDYKTSQVVEDNMRGMYEQRRQSADALNDKAIALLIAREEATDARRLYQMLFSRLKEAGVIDGLRSSNISVVDAGRTSAVPLPDIPIALALSLLCGCFIGVGAAVFTDATDDRVEGMANIENALRTKILAILPQIQSTSVWQRLANGSQKTPVSKVALLDGPNTAYVEALRSLRTSLLLSRNSEPLKTILITSAAEQEGKSTVSLNLAAVLALNGSRVLLVDADLRGAGLSSYMGYPRYTDEIPNTIGLSEALCSEDEPAFITPFAKLPRLTALTAGAYPTYPAELLGSDRMKVLVKAWTESYDYVLIDSPPVLAVTDPLILGRLTDTTLLVARHAQSTQRSLERAYQTLHEVEGRRVGIVLNGIHRNSTSFDEFYGYSGTRYYSEV